ncbi:DUF6597 domain-containing transcriptional factor [Micromonospora sp. D93]|uniref:DUF6597 domain-containing transcriptional factor n=1 Tax=Micromonospora sp. D93 TaxID=2824886 RepID=UPI0035A930DE
MRHRPRGDSRGILDPGRLLREVRFRRHLPAESLRPWVEHYWLIDWVLNAPFEQRVVPHPAVNVVFRQRQRQRWRWRWRQARVRRGGRGGPRPVPDHALRHRPGVRGAVPPRRLPRLLAASGQ